MNILLIILLGILGIVALFLVIIALLGLQKVDRTPEEVANILERFVADAWTGGDLDAEWDDFVCVRIRDPQLEAISRRCALLPDEFPPEIPGSYAGDQGMAVIQEYIRALRGSKPTAHAGEAETANHGE